MRVVSFFLFCLLVSCGPSSLEDYRSETTAISRQLLREYQSIHSLGDIREAGPHLRHLYLKIAEVARSAELRQEKGEISSEQLTLNKRMQQELTRIYRIEGARQLMEYYQEEALQKM